MPIASTELRQIFRAYTKQLRGEYVKARSNEQGHETRARGFERVDISDEARALAASRLPQAAIADPQPAKEHKSGGSKTKEDTGTSENDQDTPPSPKADSNTAEIKK